VAADFVKKTIEVRAGRVPRFKRGEPEPKPERSISRWEMRACFRTKSAATKEINNQNNMSIHLLHGGNSFARKRAKKYLVDKLCEPGIRPASFYVPANAEPRNPVFDSIRQKLTGSSLFAEKEIVSIVFLAPEKLGRGRARQDKGTNLVAIQPFLGLLPPNLTLIIEVAADLAKSTPLLKLVEKMHGEVQAFKLPPLKDKETLFQAIRNYLTQEKIQIEPHILTRLVMASQGDWWFVFTALEQAVLLNRDGKLRSDNLLKLWDIGEDQSIFQLFDAIGRGDKAKALTILFENNAKKSLKTGQEVEQALGLISLMARQLRQLVAVKSNPDSATAQKVWLIPFFALPKLKQQAAHFSSEFLAQAFEKLVEVQEKAKRGLYSPLPLLDFYVLYLISHRKSL
jgi:DNA polymerase III delta subunit